MTLRNVLPGSSINDRLYARNAHGVFASEQFGVLATGIPTSDLDYLRSRQLGASTTVPAWVTPLLKFVLHIVYGCAQKQVRRVDARGIIAAVKNIEIVGYRTKVQPIRLPVSAEAFFSELYKSVAVFVFLSLPFPTFIISSSINERPKLLDVDLFGGAARVSLKITEWLTDYPTKPLRCLLGDVRFLPATALAVAMRDFISGIMEGHQKFTFLVSNPGAIRSRCPVFLLGTTGVIIPRMEAI